MDIMVDELHERLDAKDELILVDVREPYEHEEFSVGGQNIPLGALPQRVNEIDNNKDKEVIVYCRSGGRSGMAQQMLQQQGFSNVRNLVGGMLEWQRRFPS